MSGLQQGIKRRVRSFIAEACYRSRVSWLCHRGKVVILTYHRVLTQSEVSANFVQSGMYVLQEVFERHIRYLKQSYTILSLEELLEVWRRKTLAPKQKYCIVTFDDGWVDNYRYAYPILRCYDIPATIFLPTDYIGTHEWFWPDRLAFVLETIRKTCSPSSKLAKGAALLQQLSLADVYDRGDDFWHSDTVVDQIIERGKDFPLREVQELVATLAKEWNINLPQERVVLNWDEVGEMSKHNISFGSHSCSHQILTNATEKDVLEELSRSKAILTDKGILYVPVFCYPNGNSNASIQALVKNCGYQAAVGVGLGVEGASPGNRYNIRRIGIHNDISDTVPLFAMRLLEPILR